MIRRRAQIKALRKSGFSVVEGGAQDEADQDQQESESEEDEVAQLKQEIKKLSRGRWAEQQAINNAQEVVDRLNEKLAVMENVAHQARAAVRLKGVEALKAVARGVISDKEFGAVIFEHNKKLGACNTIEEMAQVMIDASDKVSAATTKHFTKPDTEEPTDKRLELVSLETLSENGE
jgi:translation initiation factor 2 beta subunit (eIF-2beta)/eIF-5